MPAQKFCSFMTKNSMKFKCLSIKIGFYYKLEQRNEEKLVQGKESIDGTGGSQINTLY